MKVVIVGGVAGGASAAARLRRLDEQAEIVLLERGECISYANCGLPYYVGGAIEERESLTLQTPEAFRQRFRIDVRVGQEAVKLDLAAHTVTVDDHTTGEQYPLTYDRLLLSPGAEPLRPAFARLDDPRLFTLRTIPDAERIRSYVREQRPRSAVIIGGGYIGVEMAENLVHAGLEVSIVEQAEHLIAPLDRDMAADVHRYLAKKGVRLLLGSGVTALEPAQDGLKVKLQKGELTAELVLLCVGVRPETALAREAGLACNERGAIVVDPHMRTSAPDVYAVGDAIEITNSVSGAKGYIPLAGPANRQGRIAADNIAGLNSAFRGTQGTSVLKLFEMTVACTGLNERQAQSFDYDKVYLYPASHATYYPGARNMSLKVLFERGSGRILGAQIVGFEGVDKRIDVLATAISAGMSGRDLAQLELAYAPPFSSAKDPVNMAGFVIENLLDGRVRQHHWHDVAALPADAALLDTRTVREYGRGHIEGAINIPLDSLRERIGELEPYRDSTLYVNCQSGLRSYLACRILTQQGFDCSNLAGGYRLYESVTQDPAFDGATLHPCGLLVER